MRGGDYDCKIGDETTYKTYLQQIKEKKNLKNYIIVLVEKDITIANKLISELNKSKNIYVHEQKNKRGELISLIEIKLLLHGDLKKQDYKKYNNNNTSSIIDDKKKHTDLEDKTLSIINENKEGFFSTNKQSQKELIELLKNIIKLKQEIIDLHNSINELNMALSPCNDLFNLKI
jgi:hypothetical protein